MRPGSQAGWQLQVGGLMEDFRMEEEPGGDRAGPSVAPGETSPLFLTGVTHLGKAGLLT